MNNKKTESNSIRDYYENYFLKLILKDTLINYHLYTIKSAIAGILSIMFATFLVPEDLLSASFAAILCIKPTFYSGIVFGKEQFLASFIGGIITGIILIFLGQNIYATGLALIIVMLICLYKRWNNYLTVAIFTTLYMVLIPQETTIKTVAVRISSVLLGVLVASLVNLVFSVITYKSFFYFRVKLASSLVFERLNNTIEGNQKANIQLLDNLYFDYEEIYSQLNGFGNELIDFQKELRVRKKFGVIREKEASVLFGVIESLKVGVHYLHDITYISKILAPNHNEIPQVWKDKLDVFWQLLQEKFKITLNKLFLYDISKSEVSDYDFDINFIHEISEGIKGGNERQKIIFADVLALAIYFQQLFFTLSNFDYFTTEYIKLSFKREKTPENQA